MNTASHGPSASDLASLLGTDIDNLSLYHRALTHRSCLREADNPFDVSNERLEYVGDAFLDLLVGVALYTHFPDEDEGFLSRMRARLVSGRSLAQAARRCNLGSYLLLSRNAERNNGRSNPSILADAFEAITGALYLDRGHEAAARFARCYLLDAVDLDALVHKNRNYKSLLQEHLQGEGRPLPTYTVVDRTGPDHNYTFTVEALVEGEVLGRGTAPAKKEAEQRAAREAVQALKNE